MRDPAVRTFITLACLLPVLLLWIGCQSTYYAVWESLGKEKRHLLRDEVEQAREDQAEASEEFKDALTRIKQLTGFQGGELENVYLQLKDDYEDCERRAAVIDERIDSVEQIAADLFAEWEGEIEQMTNPSFRSNSRQSLARTRERYNRLHRTMVQARNRMTPVLSRLNDYVLYLKHNLNARAVGDSRPRSRRNSSKPTNCSSRASSRLTVGWLVLR